MTIRPPLTFDVIKPEVKHYLRFNPESGMPIGCSVEAKGHCVEISEELATQIKKGHKNLLDYRIKLKNNQYVVEPKNGVQNVTHNMIENNVIENRVVYEIKKNKKDACIRFLLDTKTKVWNITLDEELKNNLKTIVTTSNNTYKFFTTSIDNSAVLDYEFTVNLNDLISKGALKIPHQSDNVPRLFCRKVYNYSYEVAQ